MDIIISVLPYLSMGFLLSYLTSVALGFTCFWHDWRLSGAKKHMAIDTKTKQLVAWEREQFTCSKCLATKQGKRIE